jgi:hypothetical protein
MTMNESLVNINLNMIHFLVMSCCVLLLLLPETLVNPSE